ncbi:hypothetical protein PSY22_23305, partial [Shigella flexneri]|nr:hypothetical protein [Shigella flexneri]
RLEQFQYPSGMELFQSLSTRKQAWLIKTGTIPYLRGIGIVPVFINHACFLVDKDWNNSNTPQVWTDQS